MNHAGNRVQASASGLGQNEEKARIIRAWIDPEERVTLDFHDERGLNAQVLGCSANVVELSVETNWPYVRQNLFLPLRLVNVTDDPTHYTRDPARPPVQGRLRLSADMTRPPIVY